MKPAHLHVSVVVPVYSAQKTIVACLNSLISQAFPEGSYRIIVVDNGSRDRTLEILRRYESSVTVVHESVRGPAAARNLGILLGGGDIVAFVDADCIAAPDWLSNLISQFDDQSIAMVGGRIESVTPKNEVQLYGERIHDHKKAIEFCNPPYIISMNSAVRRTVLAEVGLFDNTFRRGEDVDLSWRIRKAGYQFQYAPDAVIYHHNESTLRGLLREGLLHGYYGVKVKRDHDAYLVQNGRHRNTFGNLRRTLASFRRYLQLERRDREHMYAAIFNGGKTVGSLLGYFRFGYFDI